MRTWELGLALGPDDGRPLYRRIAALIADDIARGRLNGGERLPSSRELAGSLGVNRNTVVAALEVLRTDGWIAGRSTQGTFVVEASSRPTRADPASDGDRGGEPGFDLGPALHASSPVPRTADLLLLLGGVPELRFAPHRELARAYGQALRGPRSRRLLDYADPLGDERLRAALAELLARVRGIAASPASICVVRGSQHGLYLAARALVREGDAVAVEAWGYPPAHEVFRLAGAALVPIPVDAHGIDLTALEAVCAARPVRAIVLTPHHQFPTTVTLAPERRERLLALAARHRIAVIEDDYDFDFHYDGPPVLPLASRPGGIGAGGVVVYVATLSKTLAPGLRLGSVVAAPAVIERIAAYRSRVDQQGDHVVERAIALLLEDGVVQRHVRRARRVYRARRDALCEALAAELPELAFAAPPGGMAVWAQAPGVDTAAWEARGRAHGVAFQSGARFALDGGARDRLRIGFAACAEAELVEAVRRMARARR